MVIKQIEVELTDVNLKAIYVSASHTNRHGYTSGYKVTFTTPHGSCREFISETRQTELLGSHFDIVVLYKLLCESAQLGSKTFKEYCEKTGVTDDTFGRAIYNEDKKLFNKFHKIGITRYKR